LACAPGQPDDFGSSLWEATAGEGQTLPVFGGSQSADIAIIGAGIAGMSSALHLVEQGMDVVVLEAGLPGCEATGRSGGIIAPDFTTHSPATIQRKFGTGQAEWITGLVGGSGRFVFDLVARYGIACAAQNNGFLWPAHNIKTARKQKLQQIDWAKLGFNVKCLSATETMQLIGSRQYCGALLFEDGGGINPLAFVRGLAAATLRQDGQIFVNSPVLKLTHSGNRWCLQTPEGELTARRVILAANGGNAGLHPALHHTVVPLQVFEFATQPLPVLMQRQILGGGITMTDKQPYMLTARFDHEGRLVSGFPAPFSNHHPGHLLRTSATRLSRFFPALGQIEISCLWRGTAWLNPSLLPAVYNLGEGALAIQACNGRGLAVNTILGREVAAWLCSGSKASLSLPLQQPRAIPAHFVARYVPRILSAGARMVTTGGNLLHDIISRGTEDS